MSQVGQRDKQQQLQRHIKTSRTQTDYETHIVKASPELWIQNILREDEETNRNILKAYGIDRISLKTAGILQADRIYNSLFIYSQGVYNSLDEVTQQSFDKKSIMCKLWKVYMLLATKCKPKSIEDDPAQNQEKMTINILQDQFQSLLTIKEQDLSHLKSQIKNRDEAISILEHKLNLQTSEIAQYTEMIEQRDRLFSQETKKRVSFETKISQIQSIFNQQLQLNDQLKEKLIERDTKLTLIEQELDLKRKEILNLQITSGDKEQRIEALKCKSFDAEICVKILREQNQQLELKCQEFENQKQKDFSLIQQSNYQNSILNNQVNKMELLNKQLLSNNEKYQQQQNELMQDVERKQEQFFSKVQEFNKVETQLKILIEDKNQIEKQFNEISQQYTKNQKELQELQIHSKETQKQLSNVVFEKNQMELKLTEINNLHNDYVITYQELKHEYEQEVEIKEKIEIESKRKQDIIKQLENEKKLYIEHNKDVQKRNMLQQQQQEEKTKFLTIQMAKQDEKIQEMQLIQDLLEQSKLEVSKQVEVLNEKINENNQKYQQIFEEKQQQDIKIKQIKYEQTNMHQEYKKNEDLAMAYSIKFHQIKDYPEMYREMKEQNSVTQTLIDKLNQQIAILNTPKSCLNNSTQTEINKIDQFQQYEQITEDKQQQTTEIITNVQEIQTNQIELTSIQIQTEICYEPNVDLNALHEKMMQRHLSTQVDIATQANDNNPEWLKQSIENEKSHRSNEFSSLGHRYQSQHSYVLDDYPTRLQPQYDEQIKNQEQRSNLNSAMAENYVEQIRIPSKNRGRYKKAIELPQLQNNSQIEKGHSYTPSCRFARLYVQASVYYKK